MPLIKKYLYYSLEANLIKYELILLKKFEDSLDEDSLFERKKLNWKDYLRTMEFNEFQRNLTLSIYALKQKLEKSRDECKKHLEKINQKN